MEEKLKTIAKDYLDFVHRQIKNPDADVLATNDCIRTLHFMAKMGIIPASTPEYSREHRVPFPLADPTDKSR